jgi:hypothetical protein
MIYETLISHNISLIPITTYLAGYNSATEEDNGAGESHDSRPQQIEDNRPPQHS